jgi:hypothetical protein
MTGTGTPDQIQQIWFLKWAQYALWHGHNPFYSQMQNYPVGLNLLVNTSMMALGVVFSPITSLFGPIVTWNILLRLAFVLSAGSMCFVLRRWTVWWPAAFVGGLLYGFSAYATFYGGEYLFLAFVPLPPLIFLLLHEILERQRWRPARTGALLGAACGVQFFISAEVLASTTLMAVLACVIFFCVRRKNLTAKLPYMKTAFGCGVIAGGVLLVYPVVFMLFGRAHIHGVPQLAGGQGDLLGAFVPGNYLRVASAASKDIWTQFVPYFYSASLYLGIPFIVVLLSIVVWLRRRPMVLFCGAMTAIAFILSLGSTLHTDQHNTHIPLPFILLAHLPVLDGLIATRFSLFTNLFGAGVMAMGLDGLYWQLKRSKRPEWLPRNWRPVGAAGVSLAVAALVAIPLLPSHTEPTSSTRVPSLFHSSSNSLLQAGSVVLAYPYPSAPVQTLHGQSAIADPFVESVDDSLLDQAVSGMRFSIIGGYGWTPPQKTKGVANPSPLPPLSVRALFDVAFYGSATRAQRVLLSRSNLTADLRKFMRRYHVDTVIVLPLGQRPATVVSHVTAAIGRPLRLGGVTVWLHVQQHLSTISH